MRILWTNWCIPINIHHQIKNRFWPSSRCMPIVVKTGSRAEGFTTQSSYELTMRKLCENHAKTMRTLILNCLWRPFRTSLCWEKWRAWFFWKLCETHTHTNTHTHTHVKHKRLTQHNQYTDTSKLVSKVVGTAARPSCLRKSSWIIL